MRGRYEECMSELRRRIRTPTTKKGGPGVRVVSFFPVAPRFSAISMINDLLEKISAGKNLSRAEAESVMEQILSGGLSTEQIVPLLVALKAKGETLNEVVGFAT